VADGVLAKRIVRPHPGPGKAGRCLHCTAAARGQIRGVFPGYFRSCPLIEGFPPDFHGCSSSPVGPVFCSTQLVQGLRAMGDQLSIAGKSISTANKLTSVVISPWVNEPPAPLHNLLSSHDVARLTRRPSWLITSLSLIGRFPRKAKFHGRRIGWLRCEVLDWMARDLHMAEQMTAPGVCPRHHTRQISLPFDCTTTCAPVSACSNARRRKPGLLAGVRQ
jgi:hypothetical protein